MIVTIFNFLELEDLLTKVNRVCKQFYSLIKETSTLWRNIDFFHPVELTEENLSLILRHSRKIQTCFLPYATSLCSSSKIDRILTRADFRSLVCLNLSDSKLSTLCFLYEAHNLELVNLSGCTNLVDEDFLVLKENAKLEHIYVSFTRISPNTLQIICENKPLIVVDACNVKLNVEECRNILINTRGDIVYFHISLCWCVNAEEFKQEILDLFLNTSISIYQHV